METRTALVAVIISVAAATAQAQVTTTGFPSFQTTSATIYPCEDKSECMVKVLVDVSTGKCTYTVPDFIDRHPSHPKQKIVWEISSLTANYEVQFGNNDLKAKPGIEVQVGKDDVDDDTNGKKVHKKMIKKQTVAVLLYDIHAEFKATDAASWTRCDPKGPAIINRG